MDTPGLGLLSFLLLLLGGGGTDLLDYLPTDFYWQQKEAVVSVGMLRTEIASSAPAPAGNLARWIGDLGAADAATRDAAAAKLVAAGPAAIKSLKKEAGSDDVEVAIKAKALIAQIISESKPKQVRRLMAIRTIGEGKFLDAMPDLQKLKADPDPFIAQYAAEAIARIERKPLPPRQPVDLPTKMDNDLWLLPENTGAVGQIRLRPGLSPTVEELVSRPGTFNANQAKQRLELMGRTVLELAEAVGDVRIDGVTFGISNDISDRSGSLVIIARGQFDPEAAAVATMNAGAKTRKSGDIDLFFHGPEASFFFPSPDRAVLFASPSEGDGGAAALKTLTTAVKNGKGDLAKSKDLLPLIKAADRTKPIWAVAKISDQMKAAAFLPKIDTVQLSAAQPKPGRLEFSVSAKAADAAGAEETLGEIQLAKNAALRGLNPLAEIMKPLRPLRDFLTSVKTTTESERVSATAGITGSITELYLFSEAPYTEPVVPPPAPGEPPPKEKE